jgi:hypothetical protein
MEFNDDGGVVTLRGVKIEVNSDIGAAFVVDCVRQIEGLITAEALRAKYGLDDDAWQQLATNEPLQLRVRREKERRVRVGEAARERAAFLFVNCRDVLDDIIRDPAASPRHKVESIRELRQIAAVGRQVNAKGLLSILILGRGTSSTSRWS